MTKAEIAGVLEEIGTLLELKGENPFKVRAYRAGARVLESIEEGRLAGLVAENGLETVPGIGQALAQKIAELHTTGRLDFHEKLKASIEPGLVEMLQIPGLGPKKIKALHERLGIDGIERLARACESGDVANLDGFGERTQAKILAGIRNREAYGRRRLWWDAAEIAGPIIRGLRALPQVIRAEAAGSLRRGLETVGDLDFLVAATESAPVMEWFSKLPQVREVTASGETKTSVRFESGLQADLRIVPEGQFVFALHHFTGSKEHNVQMRQRALSRGLSLSEWGIAAAGGDESVKAKVAVAGPQSKGSAGRRVKTEKELFALLGLEEIPPELREGLGELAAAERGGLPRLVELKDLRGAFHNHTTASDGHNTLAEMAAAAEGLGWEYLGIADHSKSSFQANGLGEDRLLKQVAEIRALNASGRFRTHIFAGVECDILADGALDFDDDVLGQLDYVVASVHNAFTQDEATMTARILRAVENPNTTMVGHLTGRLLLRREGYRVDISRVLKAAIERNVVVELNANPQRLDLDWRHWRRAASAASPGEVPICSVNPDAHDKEGLAYVRAGINSARKGWLTPGNVLNCRPLADVKEWLEARRKG
jgi:DNA polymerase (family X)